MSLEFATLGWLIPAAGLLLGYLAGEASGGHRFCAYGALSDLAAGRPAPRAWSWGLAVVVAMVGTAVLHLQAGVDPARSLFAAPRLNWLAHLVGGIAFGAGMVLARGCAFRTLTRAGGGSLAALVTLLCVAVSAAMTLRGLFALPRLKVLEPWGVELPVRGTLPNLLQGAGGLAPAHLGLGISLLLAAAWVAFALRSRIDWRSGDLWRGAGMGLLVVAGWWVTGHLGYVPEHPETLEEVFVRTNSNGLESLSLVSPLAYGLELLVLWTDESRLVTFGIASMAGIALAGWAGARRRGEGAEAEDLGQGSLQRHMLGGTLMGFGAVTATGCTVGQGLSGLSTLAPSSLIACAGIVIGALGALRRQPEIPRCGG
ncbi:MAG: conserved hypothetical rane protein [Rhodocyclaceae bacterium]|nr:conserved hypothetical rane protein [Rhodocyclaceae bacterium]